MAEQSVTLVTGGTGHLGADLVPKLIAAGRRVRLLGRRDPKLPGVEWAQGDLASGVGVEAAVRGANTVVHAATNSPIARRGGFRPIDFFRSPVDVDVQGTVRLLRSAEKCGVEHFLHVSIVGLDAASLPYARNKLAAEALVQASELPWSIVRAMPFFYLLERFLSGMRWLPIWPLPRAITNPVDTSDVASYIAECVAERNLGIRADIGGPEPQELAVYAAQYLHAERLHRKLLPFHLSTQKARAMGFVVATGRVGSTRWQDWLSGRSRQA